MRKVIGMDLGDKRHVTVVFDETGEEVETGKINNTATQIRPVLSEISRGSGGDGGRYPFFVDRTSAPRDGA